MTVDRVRLQGLVEAWDLAGGRGELPDEVALALDADPAFRAWFDARLPPWTAPPDPVPADLERRFVRSRGSTRVWWLAGAVAGTAAAAAVGLVVAAAASIPSILQSSSRWDIGPREEGEYFADFATVDRKELEETGLMEGLEEPFNAFVMKYNAEASGRKELIADSKSWDRPFYEHVVASTYQHVQWKRFFRRLEEVKDEYATVTTAMQAADLPEVFAGIPFRESTYLPDLQSDTCARGWWQQMPEVANRHGLRVKSCHFNDAEATWEPAPNEFIPPARLFKNAVYISGSEQCRITKCDIDDRTNLELSTGGAIADLQEVWADPTLRESGALVQIALLSHNAGYDDGRYGVLKLSNLLPAFKKFAKSVAPSERSNFAGAMITCTNPDDRGTEAYCGSVLNAETQHYAYPIVARHILAVCYYGKNHADMPAFAAWAKYTNDGHYCTQFNIPTPADVK